MEVICADGRRAELIGDVPTGLINMLLPDGGPTPSPIPYRVETAGSGPLLLGHDVDFPHLQEVVSQVCQENVAIELIS